ncbi:hypothetical protein Desgi_1102 [Desulfoscipio gibsoniae DSM 7213]|uniref:Uncharacterized protein n=1 Tax=Desulfoscipio gibsoniae DSM 7213 TaxID=767817 RepID=R4KG36_9FIRM|nr:hypothetical protein Desgi_1102 [Desulfoscipio gibsoniae DSM 7213]
MFKKSSLSASEVIAILMLVVVGTPSFLATALLLSLAFIEPSL